MANKLRIFAEGPLVVVLSIELDFELKREGVGADVVGMVLEHAAARPCRRVPQPHRLVQRGRRDQLPVRREGDGADVGGMALEQLATWLSSLAFATRTADSILNWGRCHSSGQSSTDS